MSDSSTDVTVRTRSIVKRLSAQGHDGVHLVVEPRGGLPLETLVVAVDAAREQANDSVPAESTWASGATLSPKGVLVRIVDPGSRADFERWLTTFAQGLSARDVAATVGPAPIAWLPAWLQAVETPRITGHVALTLAAPVPAWEPRPRRNLWLVDRTTTERLAEHALRWGAHSGDRLYYEEAVSSFVLQAGDISGEIADAVERSDRPTVTYVTRSPLRVRRVSLGQLGEVMYQFLDETQDWASQLDAVRSALTEFPASLDFAAIRLNPHWGDSLGSSLFVPPRPPHVDPQAIPRYRSVWDRLVPDAHGVQVLTEAHLDSMSSTAGWDVEEIAPGRFLVQSRDLAPWFSGSGPDAATLEAARRDFGRAILDPAKL